VSRPASLSFSSDPVISIVSITCLEPMRSGTDLVGRMSEQILACFDENCHFSLTNSANPTFAGSPPARHRRRRYWQSIPMWLSLYAPVGRSFGSASIGLVVLEHAWLERNIFVADLCRMRLFRVLCTLIK